MSSESQWIRLTLKAAGVSLIDCDHRTPAAVADGMPYIAIPQLRDGHISLDGVRRISEADYIDWTKKLLPQANDVIVVRRCNSGESAHVPAGLKCAIGQNLVVLRADGSKLMPQYLRWLVRGTEWWAEVSKYINVGAVFDSLRCKDIPLFELPVPPLEEQGEIANALTAIDDRITLLRETNATLEAIAQALFKSWFVDFDPVRAKMEGRAPEGMDEATVALFPDGFEESALGLVPKGWRVATLSDAFEINPKRALKKATTAPYLDMASLATSGHCVEPPVPRPAGSGSKFVNGDTLLARITPCLENGKTSFVDCLEPGEVGWGSTEFIVLRAKTPWPDYMGYLLCRHPAFRDYAIRSMSGTSGRQRVQNEVLARYPLVLAGGEIACAFRDIVEPIQRSIAANHAASQTLATLRDTLLPRLISGQLRLPAAEDFSNPEHRS